MKEKFAVFHTHPTRTNQLYEVSLHMMRRNLFLLVLLLAICAGCSSSRKTNCNCPPMGQHEIRHSDFALNKK